MTKTILVTGSTDGIGLETAKVLVSQGHRVLIHGRSDKKLAEAERMLSEISSNGSIECYRADLSHMAEVKALAQAIAEKHEKIDVLINNAGVYKIPNPVNDQGYDLRFIVNTVAPYLLTKQLQPLLSSDSRVVNLSSAAQTAVDLDALEGKVRLSDSQAYGQSKLALTMWSFHMSASVGGKGPVIVSVNPASLLGSKMVKEAYGLDGADLSVGADILERSALSDEFANASGRYFDNDHGQFATPHPDALNGQKNQRIVETIETIIEKIG
ncbi:MAG: SDR family NAD(P)-dependent oxidoreductase [Motiliproteus sp.]|nr:SDR family NAD(P)-dependent oxidoreductase [Motiliproteus sp.]MCW9052427.1 SDR family NAD(P)-dependent oxidoreductase [Motiliproteus sp.]